MDVIKTLAPGKPGTKRYMREWGHSLVAVRYRRDLRTRQTLTTIEIIVDRRPYNGKEVRQDGALHYRNRQIVAIHIDFQETLERIRAKEHGAKWSAKQKLWLMRYETVIQLGYLNRIQHGAVDLCTDVDMSLF